MSAFYNRMPAVAERLVTRFNQDGTERQVEVVVQDPDPLRPPSVTTGLVRFRAVARGVSAQFIGSDPNLVATDIVVITDVNSGYAPRVNDKIEINGRSSQVVRVDATPSAGSPIFYRFFVR